MSRTLQLVALALALLLPLPAMAQSVTVSNLPFTYNADGDGDIGYRNSLVQIAEVAAGFSTGANSTGYVLQSITAGFGATIGSPAALEVTLHAADGTNALLPGAVLATLTGASPSTAGQYQFRAPADGVTLAANTSYVMVMQTEIIATVNTAYRYNRVRSTNIIGETVSTNDGWQIASRLNSRTNSTANWSPASDETVRFRVDATKRPPAASTVSNLGEAHFLSIEVGTSPGSSQLGTQLAQQFTTGGTSADHFHLNDVVFDVRQLFGSAAARGKLQVALHRQNLDAGGQPLAILSGTTPTATGEATYSAPAGGVALMGASNYFIIWSTPDASRSALNQFSISLTSSSNESGSSGWSINNQHSTLSGPTNPLVTNNNSARIRIRATMAPPGSVISTTVNATQTLSDGDVLTVTSTGTINAPNNGNAVAAVVTNTGAIVLNSGAITGNTSNNDVHALHFTGNGNALTNESGGTITTTRSGNFGAQFVGDNNRVTNRGTVTTNGEWARGLNSDGNNNRITNESGATVETTATQNGGRFTPAIEQHGGTNNVAINRGTLTVAGTHSAAAGIRQSGGGNRAENHGTITTNGRGINQENGNNLAVNEAGGTIRNNNGNGHAPAIEQSGGGNTAINHGTLITTAGHYGAAAIRQGGDGNFALNSDTITTNGNGAHAIVAGGNANTVIMQGGSITSGGHGIEAFGDNNTITMTAGTITANNGHAGIAVDDGNPAENNIVTISGGRVQGTGNNGDGIRIDGDNNTISITAAAVTVSGARYGIFVQNTGGGSSDNNTIVVAGTVQGGTNSIRVEGTNNVIVLLSTSRLTGEISLANGNTLINMGPVALGAIADQVFSTDTPVTLPLPVSGGTAPFSFTVSPPLPAGLSINAAADPPAISGMPQAASAAADYTLTVSDSTGRSVNGTFEITVNASRLADGTEVFVENLSKYSSQVDNQEARVTSSFDITTPFTTRNNGSGYYVRQLVLGISNVNGSPPPLRVAIHAANGNVPGAELAVFSGANPSARGEHSFTPPFGLLLAGNTTYYLVLSAPGTGGGFYEPYPIHRFQGNNVPNEETNDGWRIEDRICYRTGGGNWSCPDPTLHRGRTHLGFRINATSGPEICAGVDACTSNLGQGIVAGGAYVGRFGSGGQNQQTSSAQSFTTGGLSGGNNSFALQDVTTGLVRVGETGDLVVTLHEDSGAGPVTAPLATLTGPKRPSARFPNWADFTYSAPAGLRLRANTNYFVKFFSPRRNDLGGDLHYLLNRTASNAEDLAPTAGWSIDDDHLNQNRPNEPWNTASQALRLRVRAGESTATVQNAPPVVLRALEDITLTAEGQSAVLELAAAFGDPNAGQTLTFSALSNSPGVAAVAVDNSTVVTITGDRPGNATVTVTANDGNGGTTSQTIMVTVETGPCTGAAFCVSNLEQNINNNIAPVGRVVFNSVDRYEEQAQLFRTGGAAADRFVLRDVSVSMAGTRGNPGDLTVALHAADADGVPAATALATLTGAARPNPGGGNHTLFTYTPAAPLMLNGASGYFVVLQTPDITGGLNIFDVSTTENNEEDFGTAGWNIADDRHGRYDGGNWAQVSQRKVRMRVRAAAAGPRVNAGGDLMATEGESVTLAGTVTPAAGSTISAVAWTQTGGPTVVLAAGADNATVTFTAPDIVTVTVLEFRLLATDNRGRSGMATARVTIMPERADVNGDGAVDANDAAVLHAVLSGAPLADAASRARLLAGAVGTSDDTVLQAAIASARRWAQTGLALGGGDVNADGAVDAADALVMQYAFTLPGLLGDGGASGPNAGLAHWRRVLLGALVQPRPGSGETPDAAYRRALAAAQALGAPLSAP